MRDTVRYDYLIVGTGLFGAVFAHEMKKAGKKCICIDQREHLGGLVEDGGHRLVYPCELDD